MEDRDSEYRQLNFKKIPNILNFSGSSTTSSLSVANSTFSRNNSPFNYNSNYDINNPTPLTNTPLSENIASPRKYYNINTLHSSSNVHTGTPLSNHTGKTTNIRKFTQNSKCSFCDESLHNIFEGERIIDLNCGHGLHFDCFKELLNPIMNNDNNDIFNNSSISNNNNISNDNILPIPKKNEVHCLYCDKMTTYNNDANISFDIHNNQLLHNYDNVLFTSDLIDPISQFSNIETITPYNDDNNEPSYSIHDSDVSSNLDENPITPQSQMGMNFWDRENDSIIPLSNDSVNTLKIDEKKVNKTQNGFVQSSFQSDIELGKVLFAPEFSSMNLNETDNVGLVVNISTTEFETSLKTNNNEQFKTLIGKNKITNIIINNFEEKLTDSKIDYSNLGSLILFDFIDITIKMDTFEMCQIYLFESNIIILDNEGTNLLLNQTLNSNVFISSIYENKNDIIINLNSIKIPTILLTSENRLLRHKWYVILNKLSNKVDISEINIPLIQVSTNAWNLISTGDDELDDAIPEDIKIVNKLTSKGLDLPSKFLKRQILRPEAIPKIIIMALPLVNCEDYGLENFEFAQAIQKIIRITLNSLNSIDKLGIVFLGNNIKNLSMIGNYYGCATKNWEGWESVLESITGDVIEEEGNLYHGSQWDNGMKYIDLLANLCFNSNSQSKTDYIHQIICVSNELLNDFNMKSPTESFKAEEKSNPFLIKRNKHNDSDVSKNISRLCEKFNANFDFILLADEFRFEPNEIFLMNRYLKQYSSMNSSEYNNSDYNNKIKLNVALDFENLSELLNKKINALHKVTIRNFETCVKFPENVKLLSFESPLGEVKTFSKMKSDDNSYLIKLNNLSSGFEKSILFNLHINNEDESLSSKSKINIANSHTKLTADKLKIEFDSQSNIKLLSNNSSIENNVTLNFNIEKSNNSVETYLDKPIIESETDKDYNPTDRRESDINLSIVSRLSSVSDVYYVRRKIQLLVTETICKEVLEIKYFDSASKENAREKFMQLNNNIWEMVNSCNNSNTNNSGSQGIEKWSEVLTTKIEEIIDGYSLRNYQLSNMKCISLYLELE